MTRSFRNLLKKVAMVDVIVFAIIFSLLIFYFISTYKTNRRSIQFATVRKIEKLHRACHVYKQHHGRFPATGQWQIELMILFNPDYSGQGIVFFIDSWGNPLHYQTPGVFNKSSFDVYSWGPNGINERGMGDDLGNWDGSWPGYNGVWQRIADSYGMDERNQHPKH